MSDQGNQPQASGQSDVRMVHCDVKRFFAPVYGRFKAITAAEQKLGLGLSVETKLTITPSLITPYLPSTEERCLVFLKSILSCQNQSIHQEFVKLMYKTGTSQLLSIIVKSPGMLNVIKEKKPNWIHENVREILSQYMNAAEGNIPEITDDTFDKLLTCLVIATCFSVSRGDHQPLAYSTATARIKTGLILAYRMTPDVAMELSRKFIDTIPDKQTSLDDGSRGLSEINEIYGLIVLGFLSSPSSTLSDYVKDMLVFCNMTWHKFFNLAVIKWRYTKLYLNQDVRVEMESYVSFIRSRILDNDAATYPYLSLLKLATNSELAPARFPILYVISVVYMETAITNRTVLEQYKNNVAFHTSPLDEKTIKHLIDQRLQRKVDEKMSATPLVDEVIGRVADFLPEETGRLDDYSELDALVTNVLKSRMMHMLQQYSMPSGGSLIGTTKK